ncbi:hypothetical protein Pelo_4183 [Pelomyxa schiedti]|nr:hypothetical protein Pelo_4183 [Pelomyxa schiedti]
MTYGSPSTRWCAGGTTGCRVLGVGRGAWGVGRGAWGVGRGPWAVGRGPWAVGRGPWAVWCRAASANVVLLYNAMDTVGCPWLSHFNGCLKPEPVCGVVGIMEASPAF